MRIENKITILSYLIGFFSFIFLYALLFPFTLNDLSYQFFNLIISGAIYILPSLHTYEFKLINFDKNFLIIIIFSIGVGGIMNDILRKFNQKEKKCI